MDVRELICWQKLDYLKITFDARIRWQTLGKFTLDLLQIAIAHFITNYDKEIFKNCGGYTILNCDRFYDTVQQVIQITTSVITNCGRCFKLRRTRPGWYSHIVWVGCAAGFAKVLPFTRSSFANFVTLYQTKNAQLFLISIFCERSR